MKSQTHFWDLGVENFFVSRNLKKWVTRLYKIDGQTESG